MCVAMYICVACAFRGTPRQKLMYEVWMYAWTLKHNGKHGLPLTLQHCKGASEDPLHPERLAMAASLAFSKLHTGSTKRMCALPE